MSLVLEATDQVAIIRRAGTVLVIAARGNRAPFVVTWDSRAAELSDEDLATLARHSYPASFESSVDTPRVLSVLPGPEDGWSGTPGVVVDAEGMPAVPAWRLTSMLSIPEESSIEITLAAEGGYLDATLRYSLAEAGVVRVSVSFRVPDDAPVDVIEIREATVFLPVPGTASEHLDFSGQWCEERRPQRRPILDGTALRSTHRGRPGHDSSFLTVVGGSGFSSRAGRVWSAHLAWSGDSRVVVERLAEGAGIHGSVIGGGPLLQPREARLERGASFDLPDMFFAAAANGLDELTASWHGYVRSLPSSPTRPRPLTLNTWEAVYFGIDTARIHDLVDRAADVGVERFVLDDGWFQGRRDSKTGLGDWAVDPGVWPHGLGELATHVRARGMEFGLWFEPEMVNPDSALARRHPEWILEHLSEHAPLWRDQLVLDLASPEVFEYLLDAISLLVRELDIAYIKWDHNRDLLSPVDSTGTPGSFRQTQAVYRLIDALRDRFPALEIETCASGGGRIDLGILARTERVWASDTNDPVQRQLIQHWTGLIVPPERLGSHIGPAQAHTTFRVSDLSMRMVTALFGHAGIEWNVLELSDAEQEQLIRWSALYRELRPVLHTGTRVGGDLDPRGFLHGVVAPDGGEGVYAWVRLNAEALSTTTITPLPGLDPQRRYRVRVRHEVGAPRLFHATAPKWTTEDCELSGAALGTIGLPMSALAPAQAELIHVTAID